MKIEENPTMTNLFDIKGKTALITGSSRGIGRAMAIGLAQYGANVIVHCSNGTEKADEVANEVNKAGVNAFVVSADLSLDTGASDLFKKVKACNINVDILILNASIQIENEWSSVSRKELDTQVAINYRASLELIQLFSQHMMDQKWGRIITIGSSQQAKPIPRMIVYSSLKEAQYAMVKVLAKQLGKHNITVNNIAPGTINTDRNSKALSDDNFMKQVICNIPAGYIGDVRDCVGAAVLMCSEAGRYINGITMYIDGGTHLS